MVPLDNITGDEARGLGLQGGLLGAAYAAGAVTPAGALMTFGLGVLSALSTPPKRATTQGRPVPVQAEMAASVERQWVIGKGVRVGGQIVYAFQATRRKNRVDLAIVLSEESLKTPDPKGNTYIWVDGERVKLEYQSKGWWEPVSNKDGNSPWAGGIRAYLNFKADGAEGYDLQQLTRHVPMSESDRTKRGRGQGIFQMTELEEGEQEWTKSHQLKGVSWAHIAIDISASGLGRDNSINYEQPKKLRKRTSYENFNESNTYNTVHKPYPTSVPSLSFEVDGIAVNGIPGSTNSADIAVWLLTERLGFPANAIDETDLASARTACAATKEISIGDRTPRTITLPSRSRPRSHRSRSQTQTITIQPYAWSGVVRSSDDPLHLLRSIEYLWHGYIALSGDKVYLRPGSTLLDRPAVSYGYDDGLHIEEVETVPAGKRFNTVRLSLEACAQAEDNKAELPVVVNNELKFIDGIERIEQLRPSTLMTDYYQAQHWTHVEAKALAQRLTCKVLLPYTPATAALVPGHPVKLTASDMGWTDKTFILEGIEHTKGPIRLYLREALAASDHDVAEASAFTEYGQKPVKTESAAVAIDAEDITVKREDQLLNGEPFSILHVSWETVVGTTLQLRWTTVSGTYPSTQHDLGTTGEGRLAVEPLVDVYWQARLADKERGVSPWTDEATAAVSTKDTAAPAAPAGVSVSELAGGYRLTWTDPTEDDYDHTLITDAVDGSTATPYKTSANEIVILPADGISETPAMRTYAIKHVDTTGNESKAATGTIYPLPTTVVQYAYQIGTDTLPTVPEAVQSMPHLDPNYTPTGWARSLPAPTRDHPIIWRIERKLTGTSPQTYTLWTASTPVQVERDGLTLVAGDPSSLPAPADPQSSEIVLTATHNTISVAITGLMGGHYAEVEWGYPESGNYTRHGIASGIYSTYVIRGLDGGKTYPIKVRYRNFFGTASGDLVLSKATEPTPAPAAPGLPTATEFPALDAADCTDTTIAVRFTLPSTYGLTAQVEWGTAASGGGFDRRVGIAAGLGDGPYIIRGLEPNTAYVVQLRYRVQGSPLSDARSRSAKTKPTPATIRFDVSTEHLPRLVVGQPIDTSNPLQLPTVAALDDVKAYSILYGSLPAGLTLSKTTAGCITGTPTRVGDYSLVWQAIDGAQSAEMDRTLTVHPAPVVQRPQRAYWTGPSDPYPTIADQTDGEKTNEHFRPTLDGRPAHVQPPAATAQQPAVWLLLRTWSPDAALATNWYPAQIVDRYQAPVPAPPAPEGVRVPRNERTPTSATIHWTSSGDFFTELEWEYLEGAQWHPAGNAVSYGQEYIISNLQPGVEYRVTVRHRNPAGVAGDYYLRDTDRYIRFTPSPAPATPPPLVFGTRHIPSLTQGETVDTTTPFQLPLVKGDQDDITYGILYGSLPAGLALSETTTGRITGTPIKEGLFRITWRASKGDQSIEEDFAIYVASPPPAKATAPGLPTATEFPAIDAADCTDTTIAVRFTLPSTYGLTAQVEWGTAASGGGFDRRVGIAAGLGDGPYIIRGLEPNTAYVVQLRYRVQSSPLSDARSRSATTQAAPVSPVPDAPAAVRVVAAGDTSLRVIFDPSSIYRTRIQWGLATSPFVPMSEAFLPKDTHGTYIIWGLQPETEYQVRVAYVNDDDVAGPYYGKA